MEDVRLPAAAKAQTKTRRRWHQRWTKHQIAQHLLMIISFTTLSITGLSLRSAHGPVGSGIMRILGGADMAGTIHRIAAAILIFDVAYHLVWLVARRLWGVRGLSMLPRWQDFRDVGQMLLYFFTLRKEPPQFDRYSFTEKFDYFAAGFGCVVMIGSGLVLWFPAEVLRIFPASMARELFALAEVVHSDEAVLAVLAIVIWHLYHSHLKPGMFPLSMVFLTGRMTEEQMRRFHPREQEGLLQEQTAPSQTSSSGEGDRA